MKNFIKSTKVIIGLLALFLNTLIIFIFFMPFAFFKKYTKNNQFKKKSLDILRYLGSIWIFINYHIISNLNKIHWRVANLDVLARLPKNKSYLIISNHQSWNDVFILQFILRKQLPFQVYFVKLALNKFPIMGFVWEALDCPFLKRKAAGVAHDDFAEINKRCAILKISPCSLVIFVEGSRFTVAKKIEQQSHYENLLRPKTAGAATALFAMREEIAGIIDVSLYYEPRNASFTDLYNGNLKDIFANIKYTEFNWCLLKNEYPDEKALKIYLENLINNWWVDKDLYISKLIKVRASNLSSNN